jgi:hypothetical protein
MTNIIQSPLEIWVQPGMPEDDELVFNVHFRNAEGTEWEVITICFQYIF